MSQKNKIFSYLEHSGVYIICALLIFIMLYLSIASLISTTEMNMDNAMLENVEYRYDNLLLNIFALTIGIALIYLINKFVPHIKPFILYISLFLFVSSFGILFIVSSQSAPTHDSLIVTRAAYYAAQNDYSRINDIYFKHFPFQLGYVLYSELLIKILCPTENYLALEIINVLLLAGSYVAILDTVKNLFGNKTAVISAILLAICLPPVFFCSFLYGNIPGFFFGMLSVMFLIKFLKSDKWYFGFVSALSIGLSVCLKLNNIILFAAIVITVIFHFFAKRKLIKPAYIILAFICVMSFREIPVKIYEKRANVEFSDGVPMISWAAMGMNESFIAPGWFNANYTTVNYDSNNQDASASAETSITEIKARLEAFSQDTAYRNDFFAKKALSQFNEPSYQSIWTNQVRGRYDDMGTLANYVCNDGETTVKQYMNMYQQLIFLSVCIALFYIIRKKDILLCIYPLSILGGVIYHMIFEAKSQYFIVYFVMMIPIAAYGLQQLCQNFEPHIKRLHFGKKL